MDMTDLQPATDRLAAIVRNVPDAALSKPTPCTESSVGGLLDHVDGFAYAFTAAAAKTHFEGTPRADGSQLRTDWRTRIPERLDALAAAWRAPEAWTGMTRAGGVDLPGGVAGLIALDEVVIHGWDIAVATGQPYAVDDETAQLLHGFVAQFAADGPRDGLFGPVVPVADDAPIFDRLLGLTGRDPRWSSR